VEAALPLGLYFEGWRPHNFGQKDEQMIESELGRIKRILKEKFEGAIVAEEPGLTSDVEYWQLKPKAKLRTFIKAKLTTDIKGVSVDADDVTSAATVLQGYGLNLEGLAKFCNLSPEQLTATLSQQGDPEPILPRLVVFALLKNFTEIISVDIN
jgi:hypothetical protein